MNKIVVNFDVSNEKIPCLTVMQEQFGLFTSGGYSVINVITGDTAEKLWTKLTDKEETKHNVFKEDSDD